VKLSVIIPALDEAARIEAAVARLAAEPGIDEIIVVDGGSSDDTAALAGRAGARVIAAPRGRARQQNAGARAASGDTLLFLHADAALPPGAAAVVDRQLATPKVIAGAFRTWHRAERWGRRRAALLHLADLRSRYSPRPYGDQAIHLRAATFERIGGFPEMALMEDLELSLRLRRLGRIAVAGERVEVSGRRFESAPLYQTALVNVFPLLYLLGVPPSVLARLYGDPR
jgi:rSAM/selenodomain-associated transferase 2